MGLFFLWRSPMSASWADAFHEASVIFHIYVLSYKNAFVLYFLNTYIFALTATVFANIHSLN